MTTKPLSREFLLNLVKKDKLKEVRINPVFNAKETHDIKVAIKAKASSLVLKGRKFRVTYFTWKGKDSVRVNPMEGYVPMVSGTLEEINKAEDI